MKRNSFNEKIKNSVKGRGGYIAICVCMVAALALAVSTLDSFGDKPEPITENTSSNVSDTTSTPPDDTSSSAESGEQPVLKPESNVTDESETEPDDSSEPENPSEPQKEEKPITRPCGGDIIREYTSDALVFNMTTNDWRSHLAVDFEGIIGEKIVSAADGTVEDIYNDELFGLSVLIKHKENVYSKYCGLRNITVETGEEIAAGTEIGEMSGDIPIEAQDGTHIHFEMISNGSQIDPFEIKL